VSSGVRSASVVSLATNAVYQYPELNRALPALVSLVILVLVSGLLIPSFLLPERLLALGQQVAPLALVAFGQTLVVLLGGIDLSVGSVLTLSLVLGAGIAHGDNGMALPAIAACLFVGAFIGLINGLLVERLRLPALISTLATASIVEGAAWVYTNGAPNGSMPDLLQSAANGWWSVFPIADVIVAAIVVLLLVLLKRTLFGRRLYATGANRTTAQLTGIRVDWITISAYVLCGAFAAAGGLLLGGYIAVGSLKAGETYVLNSLAVVLIGGTSLSGGEGGVLGTLIGVAILAILTALLIQLGVPIALRSVLLALIVLVGAVLQGRQIAR